MKLSFFNLDDLEKEIIKKNFNNSNLRFFDNSINKTDISEFYDSEIICICPKSNVNKEIIDKCEKLKCIVTRSTGVDHIDTKFCEEKNIEIKNTVKYGGITVAEYQFGLILSLTRKINKAYQRVKNKSFSKNHFRCRRGCRSWPHWDTPPRPGPPREWCRRRAGVNAHFLAAFRLPAGDLRRAAGPVGEHTGHFLAVGVPQAVRHLINGGSGILFPRMGVDDENMLHGKLPLSLNIAAGGHTRLPYMNTSHLSMPL